MIEIIAPIKSLFKSIKIYYVLSDNFINYKTVKFQIKSPIIVLDIKYEI